MKEQFISIIEDPDCPSWNATRYFKDKKMTILHREDGPAIEFADGEKGWFLDGVLHRIDGPAVITSKGRYRWYLNGYNVTREEHAFLTQSDPAGIIESLAKKYNLPHLLRV